VWGNTIESYVTAVVVFFVALIVFKTLQWIILARLARLAEKTETDIDDTLIRIVKSLRPAFYYFVAFYIAIRTLVFTPVATKVVNAILLAWVIYQIVIAIQILIDHIILKKFADKDGDGEPDQGIITFMSGLAKVALWVVGGLMLLSNLGVNVTSLMAGLGIGGLAIAFALQNVFADLFSAFTIYLDKPFRVGDFIIVGSRIGTVEKIGIKSTRIRALQGEEIVISNQELTSAHIQNFKQLEERRVATEFGVTYETPNEKLEKIPGIVEDIIEKVKNVRHDRTHFKSFGDSALLFETVFYAETDDYAVYMDAQQELNLALKKAFEGEEIDMAFPTQTIHLHKSA